MFPKRSSVTALIYLIFIDVAALQNKETGAFSGDEWGEVDTRFSYCAISCMSLLKRLDAINVPKAVDFIQSCRNFDGGYGSIPGAESHAGQGELNGCF